MTLVVTEAIVLHVFDYLESSRIVRLATRELGVHSVLARGARRPRSRFGSSLDVFADGIAQFTMRPGKDLLNLVAFDLTRSRVALAGNLERFAAGSAIAEMALRFAHADPHDSGFDALRDALDALTGAGRDTASDIGIGGAWQYVAALGFAPAVDACSVCLSAIDFDSSTPFNHAAGGVLCSRCVAIRGASRELPPQALLALRSWTRGVPALLSSDAERRAHLRLLREFLEHHLSDGREMRALDAWERGMGRGRGTGVGLELSAGRDPDKKT
jgi:DNA repair protein RecO (recombination protein O)